MPEWTDYESEADFGNVLLELFAHMGDILSYYQDRVANESFLGTAQERRSIIQHLRLIGYTLSTAAPASATLTLSVPPRRRMSSPSVGAMRSPVKARETNPVSGLSTRANNPSPSTAPRFPSIPQPTGRCRSAFRSKKVGSIREEMLGTSPGTPNQQYKLTHAPLILRSLGQGQTVNRDIILTHRTRTDER